MAARDALLFCVQDAGCPCTSFDRPFCGGLAVEFARCAACLDVKCCAPVESCVKDEACLTCFTAHGGPGCGQDKYKAYQACRATCAVCDDVMTTPLPTLQGHCLTSYTHRKPGGPA